jgi:hypothetical protein
MISASVYDTISVAEFMRVAAAVGMAIAPSGDIISFIDIWMNGKSNASRANEFNAKSGSWGHAYVDKDNDPVLAMAVDVEGVTRDHLAVKLLLWQLYVKNFAAFFGR